MACWPFACKGCDRDPHTFRLFRLRFAVYRYGYRIRNGKSNRVIRVMWWRRDRSVRSRELWPEWERISQ